MLFTGSKVKAKMLLLKNERHLSFLITERVSVEDNKRSIPDHLDPQAHAQKLCLGIPATLIF